MSPARVKSMMAWLISLVGHLILLGLLLLPSTHDTSRTETSIDLITLDEIGTSAHTSSPAVRKRRPPAKKIAPSSSPIETTAAAVTASPPTNENALEGESDLGLALAGQAPRNSKERYLAGLRSQIARYQAYPQASRSFREEGTVKVRLTLARSGSLLKVELVDSSGHKRLNEAAIRAAAKAAPYRSFPEDVAYQTWTVLVPVRFVMVQ